MAIQNLSIDPAPTAHLLMGVDPSHIRWDEGVGFQPSLKLLRDACLAFKPFLVRHLQFMTRFRLLQSRWRFSHLISPQVTGGRFGASLRQQQVFSQPLRRAPQASVFTGSIDFMSLVVATIAEWAQVIQLFIPQPFVAAVVKLNTAAPATAIARFRQVAGPISPPDILPVFRREIVAIADSVRVQIGSQVTHWMNELYRFWSVTDDYKPIG